MPPGLTIPLRDSSNVTVRTRPPTSKAAETGRGGVESRMVTGLSYDGSEGVPYRSRTAPRPMSTSMAAPMASIISAWSAVSLKVRMAPFTTDVPARATPPVLSPAGRMCKSPASRLTGSLKLSWTNRLAGLYRADSSSGGTGTVGRYSSNRYMPPPAYTYVLLPAWWTFT